MNSLIKIHPADNVAVALKDLSAGTTLVVDEQEITLQEDIPQAHKVALQTFAQNDQIIKYGCPIGHALQTIELGHRVYQDNILGSSQPLAV